MDTGYKKIEGYHAALFCFRPLCIHHMGNDKRAAEAGKCTFCPCKEFETVGSILCEYCGHPPMNHVALHHYDQACKTIKISFDKTLKGEYSHEYNEPYQSTDTTVPQNIEIDPPCPMTVRARIKMKMSFKSKAHCQVIATMRRTLPTKRLSQRSRMLNKPTCLTKIKGCKNFGKL